MEATEKPKRFEEICGFEIQQAVAEHPLAILPLGSLEFHGPHNPPGSDSMIISGIAERVALRSNAVLFPTVTFTQSPAHAAHFQGTISIAGNLVGVSTRRFDEKFGDVFTKGTAGTATAGRWKRRRLRRFGQIWFTRRSATPTRAA